MIQPQILIDTGTSRLWIAENYTPDYYQELTQVFVHEEPPIVIMGRPCRQRRNVGFYSDDSRGYKYSGQFMPADPLANAPILQTLLPKINQSLGTTFNGILVNQYINGTKYLSAHSDDESGLDKGGRKMVAGLCYGPGIRTFRIRDKTTKQIVLDYQHNPCTLLVMEGDFQKQFTHEIPQQTRVLSERISITFRHHTE